MPPEIDHKVDLDVIPEELCEVTIGGVKYTFDLWKAVDSYNSNPDVVTAVSGFLPPDIAPLRASQYMKLSKFIQQSAQNSKIKKD